MKTRLVRVKTPFVCEQNKSLIWKGLQIENSCTLVPTVFRWHGKMEFKFHFQFSFSHDIELNGFELRISFFVFAPL